MTIGTIDLTERESILVEAIEWRQAEGCVRYTDLTAIRGAGIRETYLHNRPRTSELFHSLVDRKGIPDIRRLYFTEPALNIGTKLSRQQVFESNGSIGEDMISHGNFLPYFWYFIHGSRLPDDIKNEVDRLANDEPWGMDEIWKSCNQLFRRAFRLGTITKHDTNVHDEFHRLALDCGIGRTESRIIRDYIQQSKTRLFNQFYR